MNTNLSRGVFLAVWQERKASNLALLYVRVALQERKANDPALLGVYVRVSGVYATKDVREREPACIEERQHHRKTHSKRTPDEHLNSLPPEDQRT